MALVTLDDLWGSRNGDDAAILVLLDLWAAFKAVDRSVLWTSRGDWEWSHPLVLGGGRGQVHCPSLVGVPQGSKLTISPYLHETTG